MFWGKIWTVSVHMKLQNNPNQKQPLEVIQFYSLLSMPIQITLLMLYPVQLWISPLMHKHSRIIWPSSWYFFFLTSNSHIPDCICHLFSCCCTAPLASLGLVASGLHSPIWQLQAASLYLLTAQQMQLSHHFLIHYVFPSFLLQNFFQFHYALWTAELSCFSHNTRLCVHFCWTSQCTCQSISPSSPHRSEQQPLHCSPSLLPLKLDNIHKLAEHTPFLHA